MSSKYFLKLSLTTSTPIAAGAQSSRHPTPAAPRGDLFISHELTTEHGQGDDRSGLIPDEEVAAMQLVRPPAGRSASGVADLHRDRRFLQAHPLTKEHDHATAGVMSAASLHSVVGVPLSGSLSRKRHRSLHLEGAETVVRPKLAAALPIDFHAAYSTTDEEYLSDMRELESSFRSTATHRPRSDPPPPVLPGATSPPPLAPAPVKPVAAATAAPILPKIDYSAPPVLQAISESIGVPIKFRSNKETAMKPAAEPTQSPQLRQQQTQQQQPSAKRQKAQQLQSSQSAAPAAATIDLTDGAQDEDASVADGLEVDADDGWAVINNLASPVGDREAEIFLRSKRQVLSRLPRRKQAEYLRQEADRTTRIQAKQPIRHYLQAITDEQRYEPPKALAPLHKPHQAESTSAPPRSSRRLRSEVIALSASSSDDDFLSVEEAVIPSPKRKRLRKSTECSEEATPPPPAAVASKPSLPSWQARKSTAARATPTAAAASKGGKVAKTKAKEAKAPPPSASGAASAKKGASGSSGKRSGPALSASKPAPSPRRVLRNTAKRSAAPRAPPYPGVIAVSTFGGKKRMVKPPEVSPEPDPDDDESDDSAAEEEGEGDADGGASNSDEEADECLTVHKKRKRVSLSSSDSEEEEAEERQDDGGGGARRSRANTAKRSCTSAAETPTRPSHVNPSRARASRDRGTGFFAWHSADPARPPPSNITTLARRAAGKTRGAARLRDRIESGEIEDIDVE